MLRHISITSNLQDINMTMRTFLKSMSDRDPDEVLYLQSQNNNLLEELPVLMDDIPKDLTFATEVLGTLPEAANVWIGDERSVSSLHKG